MTVAMLQELADHPELAHRWTTDDYHRMLSDGSIIEGDPYELLDELDGDLAFPTLATPIVVPVKRLFP